MHSGSVESTSVLFETLLSFGVPNLPSNLLFTKLQTYFVIARGVREAAEQAIAVIIRWAAAVDVQNYLQNGR